VEQVSNSLDQTLQGYCSLCVTLLDYPGIFCSGCNDTGESAYSSQASSSGLDSLDSGWQHSEANSVSSSRKSESTFDILHSDMMSLDGDNDNELIGRTSLEITKPANTSLLMVTDEDSKDCECQGKLLSPGEFCAY
jgi:hypothetical protein